MTKQLSRVVSDSRGLLLVLAAYSLLLAAILLWPSGEPATAAVEHVRRVVLDLGGPAGVISGGRVEFALNALMVAPMPLLATLLWPRWTWGLEGDLRVGEEPGEVDEHVEVGEGAHRPHSLRGGDRTLDNE